VASKTPAISSPAGGDSPKQEAAERFWALFLKTCFLFWKTSKFFCKVHCPFGWTMSRANLDEEKKRPKMKEFLWK
jgi:hypothetical protein